MKIKYLNGLGLTQTGDESPYYKHKYLGNTRVS